MSSHKFSQLANKIVSSSRLTLETSNTKFTPPATPIILSEKDVDNMANRIIPRMLQTRTVSGIPKNVGETPPTLEEFDPLNPGKWQIGVGGKILPRLPEGTRVGKLVMGKYGLYHPGVVKRRDAYAAGLEAGKMSEQATPFDKKCSDVAKTLSILCVFICIWNTITLVSGKPLPPYQNHKPPGSA